MSTIELLAPAGSTEALLAAIEAACDAVYLGLDDFNARSRAKNFTVEELPDIITYCHQRSVKVFVTLNTLIKNNELTSLIRLLYQIVACQPDAIIIQDFALLNLLQKLGYKHIHFSTQAGIHNSLGVTFASNNGVERSILARELTLEEIRLASQKGQTEIFVHGALCYSLSGYCLFSSYLGGMSANRGKCKQPCRRAFNITKRKKLPIFSLRDLELIDFLPQLQATGVRSLKIEGRMKRAEYVSQVLRAYRIALDDQSRLEEAKKLLEEDYGRIKTPYFTGGNVAESITDQPFAGIHLGGAKVRGNKLIFFTFVDCSIGDKVKLYFGEEDSDTYTILSLDSDREITISKTLPNAEKVAVYKVSQQAKANYSHSFKRTQLAKIPQTKLKELTSLNLAQVNKKEAAKLYLRLACPADINLIPKTKYTHHYIIPLDEYKTSLNNHAKNIYWELPLFIAEADLAKTKLLITSIQQKGHNSFAISHISQLLLLPATTNILANEHIYTLNDLAIEQIKLWGVSSYILPLENDIPNLNHYSYHDGIVPIFFTPSLFTSRMPVKEAVIKDNKNTYQVVRKGKLTYTYPINPISIFSFINKLKDYTNFFIDLSTPNIIRENFAEIFNNLAEKSNQASSSKFNFKKGLW